MTRRQPEPSSASVMTAMGVGVLAMALASIFIAKLTAQQVPPLVIAFYRVSFAAAILLPGAIIFQPKQLGMLVRKDFALLAIGGLCLAVHFAAWIASLKYIPISTSIVLVNSHPVFIVIASRLFLGERASRRSLIGIAIGLVGMIVISGDALRNFQLTGAGDALALLGAIAVVGYFIVGRKARRRIALLYYVSVLYACCSILLFIAVQIVGDRLTGYGPTSWSYLVALAVGPQVIGHTLFNWAVKHVRATTISVAFLGEPVVASLLALIFFGQRPPLTTVVGGVLVLAGVYLTSVAVNTSPS